MPSGPLELVRCADCGLAQLGHTYDMSLMYGQNYGYRSGLNASMVRHLEGIVKAAMQHVDFGRESPVLDIGSNDGTLLGFYPGDLDRVGIDPTIKKFQHYYKPSIGRIAGFFSADTLQQFWPDKKFKIITSIACLYDLPDPQRFVNDIAEILHPEGIWVFEVAYLPRMLERNAFDGICQEHLEYYTLKDIGRLLYQAELKPIDVGFNDINGGSVKVTAARKSSPQAISTDFFDLYNLEQVPGELISELKQLEEKINNVAIRLYNLLCDIKAEGKTVLGYGASTKGNVLLQYSNLSPEVLPYIAEVNSDKFGCVTPGSNIPIISEAEAKAMKPDYYLVLPWHFRDSILAKEAEFRKAGGKFIFPLPSVEIV